MKYSNSWIIILFVVAMLVWVWTKNKQLEKEEIADISVPDIISTNLSTKMFNKQGKIKYKILSSNMEYNNKLKLTNFFKPEILSYPLKKQKSIWKLIANKASTIDKTLVTLEGQVKATNLSGNGYVKYAKTNILHLNLENKTMFTNSYIYIKGNNFALKGIGMKGSLISEVIEILQNVNTTYQAYK